MSSFIKSSEEAHQSFREIFVFNGVIKPNRIKLASQRWPNGVHCSVLIENSRPFPGKFSIIGSTYLHAKKRKREGVRRSCVWLFHWQRKIMLFFYFKILIFYRLKLCCEVAEQQRHQPQLSNNNNENYVTDYQKNVTMYYCIVRTMVTRVATSTIYVVLILFYKNLLRFPFGSGMKAFKCQQFP